MWEDTTYSGVHQAATTAKASLLLLKGVDGGRGTVAILSRGIVQARVHARRAPTAARSRGKSRFRRAASRRGGRHARLERRRRRARRRRRVFHVRVHAASSSCLSCSADARFAFLLRSLALSADGKSLYVAGRHAAGAPIAVTLERSSGKITASGMRMLCAEMLHVVTDGFLFRSSDRHCQLISRACAAVCAPRLGHAHRAGGRRRIWCRPRLR